MLFLYIVMTEKFWSQIHIDHQIQRKFCFQKENNISTHVEIVEQFSVYKEAQEKFEQKDVKAAAAKARKALTVMTKLAKVRRAEIQNKKNSLQIWKIWIF